MSKTNKIGQILMALRAMSLYLRRFSTRYVSNIDPLPTKYGGKSSVTVLPGTGIGPELMESAMRVFRAAEAPINFEILSFTPEVDSPLEFENALTSIRRNKVAIKGNIEIQSKDPYERSRNTALRKFLDLYVYVFFCKTYAGLENKFGNIDIVVVRQNTEGEYLMLEHEPTPRSVESLKVITKFNSERLAEFAFKYAMKYKRKEITVVHSGDVLVLSEGIFVEAAQNVSKNYPQVKLKVVEVGVAVIQMLKNPRLFDMILATNLNGSMVSNILSGMLGGPGLSVGMNLSGDGIAVFEPGARNKGSSIVGRGIANPLAMIGAGINMLHYLGYHRSAAMVQKSVYATLVFDKIRTPDLGGTATTTEITDHVIRHIKNQLKPKTQEKTDKMMEHRWKSYCPISERDPPQK